MRRRRVWLLVGVLTILAVAATAWSARAPARPPIRVGMTEAEVSAAVRKYWNDGAWSEGASVGPEGGAEISYSRDQDDWFGCRSEYIYIVFSADGRVLKWETSQSPWRRPGWVDALLEAVGL